jgi:predicted glycosyltransferase
MPVEEIHHALHFASMYMGDSQSMAVEAALLGTPGIRYNCWIGKVSVLEELEHRYHLTRGIPLEEPEKVLAQMDEWLAIPNLREIWMEKRDQMLSEKIDVTAFFVWLIENYPQSMQSSSSQ